MDTGYPPPLDALATDHPGGYRTVHYGPGSSRYAHLWLPAGGAAAPVVVLLHGGYWHARYRLDVMHALAADLAARGFAVWNVEYRRVGEPGGGWPGTFQDVAAAVDHLARLAADGSLDLTRLAVVGHSAGGHLALWCAGRDRLPDGPGALPRVRPTLAVSLAGVCDLAEAARLGLSNGAVVALLGAGPQQVPEIYDRACPTRLVPLGVPQLAVHGTADEHVPLALSTRYAAAAGEECRLLTLPGVDHFALIDPASAAWEAVAAELATALSR